MILGESHRRAIDRLPADARKKTIRLLNEHDAVRAAVEEMLNRRQRLRVEIGEVLAHVELQHSKDRRYGGSAMHKESLEKIATMEREVADLDATVAERAPRAAALRAVFNQVLELVSIGTLGHRLRSANSPPAKPRKGETPAAAMVRSQQKIEELRAEIERIGAAPIPSSLAKERARSAINELAERGRPNVIQLVAHDARTVAWPQVDTGHVFEGELTPATVPDALAVLAWLNRDAMVGRLELDIDAVADDANAMTPQDRMAAVEALKTQVDVVEREEASFFDQAIIEGAAVTPRPDMSARILLDLSPGLSDGPQIPYEKKGVEMRRFGTPSPEHLNSLPAAETRDEIWQ
ncbi:MAG: hypothetical protein WC670_09650 [Pseudolabrys sp.]|jgi:hypothetical protein